MNLGIVEAFTCWRADDLNWRAWSDVKYHAEPSSDPLYTQSDIEAGREYAIQTNYLDRRSRMHVRAFIGIEATP